MNYKNELVSRYLYLNDNINFIYAYFMKEINEETKRKYLKLRSQATDIFEYFKLEPNLFDPYTLYMFESIIFEDKPLEETLGYIYLEDLKWNPNSKKVVDNGQELITEFIQNHQTRRLNFDLIDLLFSLYENIARQSNDETNKKDKLKIIDEYIKIAKYTNNALTWYGGYFLETVDNIINEPHPRYKNHFVDLRPTRESYDIGIQTNNLINNTRDLHLSRGDKSIIYHYYHDEIPYDFKIRCQTNEFLETNQLLYAKPCRNEITINLNNVIAVENSQNSFSYFMPCPYCGYLVFLDEAIIPLKDQEKIVFRCLNDQRIIRSAFLKSELHGIQRSYQKK